MAYITFGDLKASGVSHRINLCPDDSRFRDAVNRLIRWLLIHGSWHGTERIVQVPVDNSCIVMPGCVATVQGVYSPCGPVSVVGIGYQFIPTWRPISDCGAPVAFQAFDTVVSYATIAEAGYLRSYISSQADVGKTLTFLGYDENRIWIRTEQEDGLVKDGEVITLASPFVDTVNMFSSVTAVLKEETENRVPVYVVPDVNEAARAFAIYEYWETRPHYQRFKVPRWAEIQNCGCRCQVLEALVKLEFIPVRNDEDILLIGNIPAIETGLEALKAKDDGDLARADAMFFGTRENLRLGAIPLLNQELRTYTNDRFVGHVSTQGVPGLRRVLAGFS